jgi:thiamine transport system ATP-binding protein
VALARALLRARPLLLLDEPFAALGPALKAEMLALVAGIVAESGATLMMVTQPARH